MRLIDADALIDRIKNPYEQAQVARWVNEQPTIEPEKRTEERTETHACDLIDRQAAIDALAKMMPESYTPDGSHPADEAIYHAQEIFVDCIEAIEILPPAQPERKKGKWIYLAGSDAFKCSVCGELMVRNIFNYCPWCGAEMQKGEW